MVYAWSDGMKAIQEFLKDKSILTSIILILLAECFMQIGCYKPFLKKSSYAQNVNKITDSAIRSFPTLKPNVLVLGTSIAYEGISIRRLNEKIKSKGLVAQSIAIPGSELMVQELALRKILKANPELKYIIHVNELHLPWVDRRALIDSSLAMITEMDRREALIKLKEDHYDVSWKDYIYLLIRWVAYRKDIADLILKPEKRWKEFRRELKKDSTEHFVYTNAYKQSLTPYQFNSVAECLLNTGPGKTIPETSDRHHLDALHKTCRLVFDTKFTLETNEMTDLFKIRLKNLYQFINENKIQIINVFPPVNEHLNLEDNDLRKEFWEREYKDILSSRRIDLSRTIPNKNNSDYYYDLIHFNEKGMEIFTDALAESILKHAI